MNKKVLVLGGGQMGSVIAQDLSECYETKIADINPDLCDIQFDISSANKIQIKDLFNNFDLIIGALPSHLGYTPLKYAVENGNNYVDLSFSKRNPKNLDQIAKNNKSIVFHDCGLSPGLSNLIAGRFNLLFEPKEITIMVGGISKESDAPYGHVNTWCVNDLLEEYIRPARFIESRYILVTDPLDEEKWIESEFKDIGKLEGFLSDGLRTLLDMKGPETIKEYTLRRPGHLASIKKLINDNIFIEEIEEKCCHGDDIVILHVDCEYRSATMRDEAKNGLSSMARTTAFSCVIFAKLILEDIWRIPGVYAPEDIGSSKMYFKCFNYIVSELEKKDIIVEFNNKNIL